MLSNGNYTVTDTVYYFLFLRDWGFIMKKIILATLGMGLLAVGFNASAASATTTITPSLTITAACTLDASGVSGLFPAQGAGSTAAAIEMEGGTLTVTCPTGLYKVGADKGVNGIATTRNLKAAGAKLIPYKLTINDGFGSGAVDWGDVGITGATLTGINAFSKTSGGVVDSYTIAGITTAALDGTPTTGHIAGTYTDTVTITVEW